ncbi:MAG: ArsR/SmtB family transcription factor [Enterocloster bolteae]
MNRQSANEKEKIDRHIVLDIDSEENYELFERLGKALSSRVRIRMLALLKHKSMNIVELAQVLTIPVSSAAFHVNMLEEANLINTEMLPGVRGSQKVCSSRAEDVFLSINTSPQEKERRSFSVDMPIGNYYDFRIHPTCGMVNEETYIDSCDDIKSFYSPGRSAAQLIWFQRVLWNTASRTISSAAKIQIMYHSAWKSAPRHLVTGMCGPPTLHFPSMTGNFLPIPLPVILEEGTEN